MLLIMLFLGFSKNTTLNWEIKKNILPSNKVKKCLQMLQRRNALKPVEVFTLHSLS